MKADERDRGTNGNAFGPLRAKIQILMTSDCRIDAVWRPGAGTVLIEMSGGGSAR